MTNPTDKAEMFARRIVSLIFEGGTKGDFDADVVEVTLILREFAVSLQPELFTRAVSQANPPRGARGGFLRSVENALRHGIPPEGTGDTGDTMTPELDRIWERWKTFVRKRLK